MIIVINTTMVIPTIKSVVVGLVKEDGESFYEMWSSSFATMIIVINTIMVIPLINSVVVGLAKEDGQGRKKLDLGS